MVWHVRGENGTCPVWSFSHENCRNDANMLIDMLKKTGMRLQYSDASYRMPVELAALPPFWFPSLTSNSWNLDSVKTVGKQQQLQQNHHHQPSPGTEVRHCSESDSWLQCLSFFVQSLGFSYLQVMPPTYREHDDQLKYSWLLGDAPQEWFTGRFGWGKFDS